MTDDRQWWNGKLVGASGLLGGLVVMMGIVGFLSSDDFRAEVHRHWTSGWPQAQVTALIALTVVVLGNLLWIGTRRREQAFARRDRDERSEALASAEADIARLRSQSIALDADRLDADRKLFDDLLALLPTRSRSMRFAREQPFALSYDDDVYVDLREFMHEWDDASHAFHDPKVEAARATLMHRTRAFVMHLATHSFPRRDSPQYRIYPDYDLDWETPENAFAFEAVREAERLGTEVWEAHQALVAVARSRLGL